MIYKVLKMSLVNGRGLRITDIKKSTYTNLIEASKS